MKKYLVLDVGGSAIKYAVMDAEKNIYERGKVPTPLDCLDSFVNSVQSLYNIYSDVSGIAILQVSVIKGLTLDGPILLPLLEDLPYLAKPLTDTERILAQQEADKWGVKLEDAAPISFIGTGANLNIAIECAMQRAADLLDMTVPQVMNRITISGGLEIGRAPGTVTATFRAPVEKLKKLGLWEMIKEQYSL